MAVWLILNEIWKSKMEILVESQAYRMTPGRRTLEFSAPRISPALCKSRASLRTGSFLLSGGWNDGAARRAMLSAWASDNQSPSRSPITATNAYSENKREAFAKQSHSDLRPQ